MKRGNFSNVEKAIDGYRKKGITAIYLMGVLERDNIQSLNKDTKKVEYKKQEAS